MNKAEIIEALKSLGKTDADLSELNYNELRALLKLTKAGSEETPKKEKKEAAPDKPQKKHKEAVKEIIEHIKNGYVIDILAGNKKKTVQSKKDCETLAIWMFKNGAKNFVGMKAGRKIVSGSI